MKVLITGASGFLGRNVAKVLLQTKAKVYGFDKKINARLQEQGLTYIEGDLLDIHSLNKACKGIDVVIHLAAATTAIDKRTNYLVNVLGTKNVVNACRKNNIKKIVFTSSINALLFKKSHYGKSKQRAEKVIMLSNLDYVIFRPELIYGQGDRGLAKTIKLIKSLPYIPIIGQGEFEMQPIYVKDLAKAIVLAALTKTKHKIYFAGGPEFFTFNEYINKICKVYNIKKYKIHIPYSLVLLVTKILSNFMKQPPISLEQVYSINQHKSGKIEHLQNDFNLKLTKFEDGLQEIMR